jgi:hypothetical protein
MARLTPERIRAELWRPRADHSLPEIYAIIDGARGGQVHARVKESGMEQCCLFRGELHPELAEAAPYLAKLAPDLPLANWFLGAWGESRGILVESAADMRMLRRHFRTFLMVYSEDGKPLYFRYYDPRVLRLFLPTCNAAELKIMFGPVEAYLVENDDGSGILRFAFSGSELLVSGDRGAGAPS